MIKKPVLILLIALMIFGSTSSSVSLAATNSSNKKKESLIKNAESVVNKMYKNNAYITVHTDEGNTKDIYLMYNKYKECYMESGYSESFVVMRNDYKAVTLTNPVTVGEDIGVLSSIERALELTKKGYATISSKEQKNKASTSYYVKVKGKHNIKKLYTVVSEEYSNKMMKSIFGDSYNADKYSDPKYVDKNDKDALEIEIITNKNGGVAAQCSIVIGGNKYINWWFDGYMKLKSFKLSKGWYNDSNTTTVWVKLANNLQATLAANIDEYIDKNYK